MMPGSGRLDDGGSEARRLPAPINSLRQRVVARGADFHDVERPCSIVVP